MITLKKTVLAAAVLASMGATAAQAFPIVNFSFDGQFTMRNETGAVTGGNAITGSMQMDMNPMSGAGSAIVMPVAEPLSPEVDRQTGVFFGYAWTAHDITLQATGPGTVHANMLFDWNGSLNIVTTVEFSMTPTAWVTDPMVDAYQFAVVTMDGPGADGIPGNPMDNGPFFGSNAAFDGVATISSVDMGPQPSAVPVPAAAWLLGSGLLGLVGVARRKVAA